MSGAAAKGGCVAAIPVGSIERLLKPRSVAIVGASDKPGSLGASVLSNLDRQGFSGEIYLINPKREEIDGRPCLASVDALPDGVDVAVLAIPRAGVLEAVSALAGRGVRSAIIFSAGFAEGGEEGRAEQEEIARIAAAHSMVIEGPNCLGLVNFVDRIPLTFVEMPDRPLNGRPGLAIVSQSGAMAAVLGVTMLARDIGLSYSISTGNEAASGVEDYVDWLIDDPDTRVIAMIVEQFRKPQRFLAAARRARAAGKAIVLLHPGRSSAARESAATHTGALAGDYDVMRLHVGRAGVVFAETLEELGDVAEIALRCPPLAAGGTAVLGESGAFKALMLDLAESVELPLPAAVDADSPGLRAALPPFVGVSNPLDITAQGLVDPGIYTRSIEALLEDPRFSSILVGVIQTDAITCRIKLPAILAGLEDGSMSKPVIVAGLDEGAEGMAEFLPGLRAHGIPYFPTAERVLRALACLTRARDRNVAADTAAPVRLNGLSALRGIVPEYRCKALLAPAGIPFPTGELATTLKDAERIAERIGWPVVLKAQAADLPHKSDAGGVVVGLGDADALAKGWERIHTDVSAHKPGLLLDGILVEKMGKMGVELIVGGRRDPEWGPVILAGFGGVQAELLRDVRLLPADLDHAGIIAELRRLNGAALFDGFRGGPPLDLDAAARLVGTLGRILISEEHIAEVDLNPVVIHPRGEGVIALDALIRIETGG